MKILLAIDSSALSEAVVSEVERRPWPPDTNVCVLTVIDLLALTSAVGYLEPFIKSENDAARALVGPTPLHRAARPQGAGTAPGGVQ